MKIPSTKNQIFFIIKWLDNYPLDFVKKPIFEIPNYFSRVWKIPKGGDLYESCWKGSYHFDHSAGGYCMGTKSGLVSRPTNSKKTPPP
jgi:hypothetical protein